MLRGNRACPRGCYENVSDFQTNHLNLSCKLPVRNKNLDREVASLQACYEETVHLEFRLKTSLTQRSHIARNALCQVCRKHTCAC